MPVSTTFLKTVNEGPDRYTVAGSPYTLSDRKAGKFIKRGWASGNSIGSVPVLMTRAYREGRTLYGAGQTHQIPNPLGWMLVEDNFGTLQAQASCTIPNVEMQFTAQAVPVTVPGQKRLLGTLIFQNTNIAAQAAGKVSVPFGVALAPNLLAAGEYLEFRLASDHTTICPSSQGLFIHHEGGASVQWLGAMIEFPASIAGGGFMAVEYYSGGAAPSASGFGRFTNSGLNIETRCTGVVNFVGTKTSSLNQGANDNDDVVVWIDGAAGCVLSIGEDNGDHGQLYTTHYIQHLKNSTDGLVGSRYLGRVMLPWCDVASPTPTRLTMTVSMFANGAEVRALQGCDTTETISATIGLTHYSAFYTCGTNGRWDYFQGVGAHATDTTTRLPQFEKEKFLASRMYPPLDPDLSVSSNSAINYNPMDNASMVRSMGASGSRPDIGTIPGWMAREFMQQTADDEQTMRANGLSQSHWPVHIRRLSTKNIVPTDNGPSNAGGGYTGLGNSQPTWVYTPGTSISGFQSPTENTSLWFGTPGSDHKPENCMYAYLRTAEPQFLDDLAEHAALMLSNHAAGTCTLDFASPVKSTTLYSPSGIPARSHSINGTVYWGSCLIRNNGLLRIPAWASRTVFDAAKMLPEVCPRGSAIKTYFNNIVNRNFDMVNAYVSLGPASAADTGIFDFRIDEGDGTWLYGYYHQVVAFNAARFGQRANIMQFANHLANFWKSLYADLGHVGPSAAFTTISKSADDASGHSTRMDTTDDYMFGLGNGSLTWTNGSQDIAWQAGANADLVWEVGDRIGFNLGNRPFSTVPYRAPHYVVSVNLGAKTFRVSDTPGGSPLTADATGSPSGTRLHVRTANPPPGRSYQNSPSELFAVRAVIKAFKACGVEDLDDIEADIDNAVLVLDGFNPAAEPKWAWVNSYDEAA